MSALLNHRPVWKLDRDGSLQRKGTLLEISSHAAFSGPHLQFALIAPEVLLAKDDRVLSRMHSGGKRSSSDVVAIEIDISSLRIRPKFQSWQRRWRWRRWCPGLRGGRVRRRCTFSGSKRRNRRMGCGLVDIAIDVVHRKRRGDRALSGRLQSIAADGSHYALHKPISGEPATGAVTGYDVPFLIVGAGIQRSRFVITSQIKCSCCGRRRYSNIRIAPGPSVTADERIVSGCRRRTGIGVRRRHETFEHLLGR